MLAFPTNQWKYFNYVLHNLIECFVIETYDLLDDYIEEILPKYLWREQRLKCLQVVRELYYWTDFDDTFIHTMTVFHEFVLYCILEDLRCIQEADPTFFEQFFHNKAYSLLSDDWKDCYFFDEEDNVTIEEYYSDISNFENELFEDTDFLMVADLINYHRIGVTDIEERLGINIDYYFELLPLDIQGKYQTGHITLIGEIPHFINYLKHRIENASLYQLFWNQKQPVAETHIHLIVENILDAYFHHKKVDISREVVIGNGKVDFKLFRAHQPDEKILLEIKRASSSSFKKGYEKQLQEYISASDYKNGFYLIFCFTDEEVAKVEKFISEHVYTETFRLYLNIYLIDVRKRIVPSKL
ncbi:MAG: hypothetical protein Q4B80_05705 [Aerococcaceae bacterium]|nr:hypothetical protein [Aerococcaceae bacterium]